MDYRLCDRLLLAIHLSEETTLLYVQDIVDCEI